MATWITVSANDVRITPREKSVVDLNTPQQTLQQCVDAACNLVRGYIGKRNPLADAPQVPPEVKDAVIAIALVDYLSQMPGTQLVNDARKAARDNALKLLQDIAKGNFIITAADVEEAIPPVTPSPGVTVPSQKFQPSAQDGI